MESSILSHCPRCQSDRRYKSGTVKDRQRYCCKSCGYYYSVMQRSGEFSPEEKALALKLYLEGMGLRAIGRVIGCSEVAVLNWIREKATKARALQEPTAPVEKVQMDELHTYVGNKKKGGLGLDRSG